MSVVPQVPYNFLTINNIRDVLIIYIYICIFTDRYTGRKKGELREPLKIMNGEPKQSYIKVV